MKWMTTMKALMWLFPPPFRVSCAGFGSYRTPFRALGGWWPPSRHFGISNSISQSDTQMWIWCYRTDLLYTETLQDKSKVNPRSRPPRRQSEIRYTKYICQAQCPRSQTRGLHLIILSSHRIHRTTVDRRGPCPSCACPRPDRTYAWSFGRFDAWFVVSWSCICNPESSEWACRGLPIDRAFPSNTHCCPILKTDRRCRRLDVPIVPPSALVRAPVRIE